jgi:hypothetical protein
LKTLTVSCGDRIATPSGVPAATAAGVIAKVGLAGSGWPISNEALNAVNKANLRTPMDFFSPFYRQLSMDQTRDTIYWMMIVKAAQLG